MVITILFDFKNKKPPYIASHTNVLTKIIDHVYTNQHYEYYGIRARFHLISFTYFRA